MDLKPFIFKDETAWLTQKALAELFGVKVFVASVLF